MEEQYEVFSVSFCGNIYMLHDHVDGFCPRRLLIIWRSLFCNIHIPFSTSIKSLNKKKGGYERINTSDTVLVGVFINSVISLTKSLFLISTQFQ